MSALPWMKHDADEWMSDPGIRALSLEARGLWIDMRSMMHQCEPYGHLMLGGKPMPMKVLARRVGASEADVKRIVGELREAGVLSEVGDGEGRTLTCPKMIRNFEVMARARANGAAGGNPNLKPGGSVGGEVKGGVKEAVKAGVKANCDDGVNRDGNRNGADGATNEATTAEIGLTGADKPLRDKRDKNIYNINKPSGSRARPGVIPFPTGSIVFTEPWAAIARKNSNNIDLDLLANAFRKWASEKKIALDGPGLSTRFAEFCRKHRVN